MFSDTIVSYCHNNTDLEQDTYVCINNSVNISYHNHTISISFAYSLIYITNYSACCNKRCVVSALVVKNCIVAVTEASNVTLRDAKF